MSIIDPEVAAIGNVPERPRPAATGPGDWLRRNLFRSLGDSILTVIASVVIAYVLFRLGRYVFATGRWDIVERNLSQFMYGRYPRDELWRLVIVGCGFAAYGGLLAGFAHRRQVAAATADRLSAWRWFLSVAARFWPLAVGVITLLFLARTPTPWVVALAVLAAVGVGRVCGGLLDKWALKPLIAVGALGSIASMLFLLDAAWWDNWGGFMLNLLLAVFGIALSFPLGVLLALGRKAGRKVDSKPTGIAMSLLVGLPLLALGFIIGFDLSRPVILILVIGAVAAAIGGFFVGRRTSLPLVQVMSVVYIEFFRGVPLYVLLFLSYLALGFFLPPGTSTPGIVIRATVVFTLFTAAYIAEIVRGGLQSLPRGQTEAAQALGLGPIRTNALIVLPQALRNVLPAIVGQFISLFKDTVLAATVMGLFDSLQVHEAANSQADFRSQGLAAETLPFVMFLFWVGCITLSRESQRLEKKLGVGTR